MEERQKFELVSEYKLTGDQPEAIKQLVQGFEEGNQFETLLGVTGSGKTFTMANVIQQIQKPTLIIAHNKTLADQLYGEFKEFSLIIELNILCPIRCLLLESFDSSLFYPFYGILWYLMILSGLVNIR